LQIADSCLSPLSAQNDTLRKYISVGEIQVSGNEKTHNYIINRELLFASGGEYSASEFRQQVIQLRLNLLNTSLFNFVTIDKAFIFLLAHETFGACSKEK
jgi:hypothetical protein